LAVAGITAVLLVSLLVAILGRRLPANWWQRALRFLPVGLGMGLTLTFSLSALTLVVPNPATWVTLVVALGAGAFLVGYFLPQGLRTDEHPPQSREIAQDHQDQGELMAGEDGPHALQSGPGLNNPSASG
jgi:hypothetical protein